MSTLILHAVGIDELRALFSGDEAVARSMRAWAAAAFPAPEPPPRTGLLDRLGPMSRRSPRSPVVRASVPTNQDLDDVLHGRDVPVDRWEAAWALVDVWLGRMSWSTHLLDVTSTSLDALDFTGSLAGVPADNGFQRLINHQLALPLKEPPGQASGYVRGIHAEAMASAWSAALPTLGATDADAIRPAVAWLEGFPTWARQASASGRPVPDLVALERSGATVR